MQPYRAAGFAGPIFGMQGRPQAVVPVLLVVVALNLALWSWWWLASSIPVYFALFGVLLLIGAAASRPTVSRRWGLSILVGTGLALLVGLFRMLALSISLGA